MKKKLIVFASLIMAMNCVASHIDTQKDPHIITDFEEFANLWAHAAINDLNKEELELLGTFLYYNVAVSQYELATRNALLDLQRGSQVFSFKMVNFADPQESLVICEQLSTLISNIGKELAPSRNYFIAAWQLCNKEIDQSSHQNLSLVIEQVQNLGKHSLNYWAHEKKDEIENLIENNSNKIQESIKQLIIRKNALLDLVDGTYSSTQPKSEFVEIEMIHNSLTITSDIYEFLFKTSLATDEIMALSFNLINLNLQIFNTLYQAFYAALEEKKLTPMHIVINEHGFISPESRKATLPNSAIKTQKTA